MASKTFPLSTKRIYEPRSPGDGLRILVMSLWPRGVAREHVDRWYRELGTAPDLIREWKGGSIRWSDFRRRYRNGLQDTAARQAISEIRAMLGKQPVTLLCSCEDESRCHRSVLKQVILAGSPAGFGQLAVRREHPD